MTPDLPEDPRDWPSDPFALLGVNRGADALEIKKAYTRLIRKYKPERFPEEFRRIREAYDACSTQSRWFYEPYLGSPAEPAPDEPAEAEASPKVVDEVERLWSLAVNGQSAEAYPPLAQLAVQDATRIDLPLRLYWLLALEPELDSWRTRLDWLADALTRSRLNGPAVELYRRELTVDADAALYGAFLSLLKLEAGAFEKLNVARMRVAAAGRSRSWNVIALDLGELAKCLPLANESAWLAYLGTAFDWAAWERPMPLYGHIRDELGKLRHLELANSYQFDRMEETQHVTEGFTRVSSVLSQAWVKLLPQAWAAGALDPADLAAACREAADDVYQAFIRFDRVQREFGPAFVIILMRSLDQHYYRRDRGEYAEFPQDWIRALATRLPGGWQRSYDLTRDDLLNFLVNNALHPDEFAAACEADPVHRVRDHVFTMRSDLSLKLVWLACALAE